MKKIGLLILLICLSLSSFGVWDGFELNDWHYFISGLICTALVITMMKLSSISKNKNSKTHRHLYLIMCWFALFFASILSETLKLNIHEFLMIFSIVLLWNHLLSKNLHSQQKHQ